MIPGFHLIMIDVLTEELPATVSEDILEVLEAKEIKTNPVSSISEVQKKQQQIIEGFIKNNPEWVR